jgi:hypothetical protein
MYESSAARLLRVEVKHRNLAPNRYSWQILSGDRPLPVEESTDQFRSWEDASQFGKKALKKALQTFLSANSTTRRGSDR